MRRTPSPASLVLAVVLLCLFGSGCTDPPLQTPGPSPSEVDDLDNVLDDRDGLDYASVLGFLVLTTAQEGPDGALVRVEADEDDGGLVLDWTTLAPGEVVELALLWGDYTVRWESAGLQGVAAAEVCGRRTTEVVLPASPDATFACG